MLFVIAEKGIKVKMDIKEKLVKLLGKMISPTMTIREQADSLISNEATVVRHGRWIASHDEFVPAQYANILFMWVGIKQTTAPTVV